MGRFKRPQHSKGRFTWQGEATGRRRTQGAEGVSSWVCRRSTNCWICWSETCHSRAETTRFSGSAESVASSGASASVDAGDALRARLSWDPRAAWPSGFSRGLQLPCRCPGFLPGRVLQRGVDATFSGHFARWKGAEEGRVATLYPKRWGAIRAERSVCSNRR